MSKVDWSSTCTAWVAGMAGGDPDAWARFMKRRRPGLVRIAASRGLGPLDAESVANDVEATLFQRMAEGKFVYDGSRSFNAYLATMVVNKATDYLRARGAQPRPLAPEEDPAERVQSGWDSEDDRRLKALEAWVRGMEQSGAGARDLEIWRRSALEQRPVADVAREFDVSPGAVYQARHRVNERLRAFAAEYLADDAG